LVISKYFDTPIDTYTLFWSSAAMTSRPSFFPNSMPLRLPRAKSIVVQPSASNDLSVTMVKDKSPLSTGKPVRVSKIWW
jgi:hypothetical protein